MAAQYREKLAKILLRDGKICAYCGEPLAEIESEIHIDHILPQSLYPMHDIHNLVAAHPRCNISKQARVVIPRFTKISIERIVTNYYEACKRIQEDGVKEKAEQKNRFILALNEYQQEATKVVKHVELLEDRLQAKEEIIAQKDRLIESLTESINFLMESNKREQELHMNTLKLLSKNSN